MKLYLQVKKELFIGNNRWIRIIISLFFSIYADDACHDISFINNTVIGCAGSAVLLHNNVNVYLEGNTLAGKIIKKLK